MADVLPMVPTFIPVRAGRTREADNRVRPCRPYPLPRGCGAPRAGGHQNRLRSVCRSPRTGGSARLPHASGRSVSGGFLIVEPTSRHPSRQRLIPECGQDCGRAVQRVPSRGGFPGAGCGNAAGQSPKSHDHDTFPRGASLWKRDTLVEDERPQSARGGSFLGWPHRHRGNGLRRARAYAPPRRARSPARLRCGGASGGAARSAPTARAIGSSSSFPPG